MPAPAIKVTVASFTNPGHGCRVHQVMLGSMPVCRELDEHELGRANEIAERTLMEYRGRRRQLWTWDGDTQVEAMVAEVTG